MASKRKSISLQEKVEILKEIENGKKKSAIRQEKGIRSSTLSTIIKNKDKILNASLSFSSKSKRLRKPKNEELDRAMYNWFSASKAANVPVNASLLQYKAQEFAEKLTGESDFRGKAGWISRFKARHEITFGKIKGDQKTAARQVTDDWLNSWPLIKENYSDENIFTADEFGLFFKLTPEKTHEFKDKSCISGKLSKQRLTVLVCANMTGTEKRKLLVIGKPKYPASFTGVQQLPVEYRFNEKAWITAEIFNEQLVKWDRELDNRRILLLVRHSGAHPKIQGLQNIELLFLPSNVTSVLHPMVQGIISLLKVNYRILLVRQVLRNIESNRETSITLLDAVNFLHRAWFLIEAKTIRNCFRHAGWLRTYAEAEEYDNPLGEWLKLHQEHVIMLNDGNDVWDDFITVDDKVVVCKQGNDVQLREDCVTVDSSDDEDCKLGLLKQAPGIKDVENALKTLREFIQRQENTNEQAYSNFMSLENEVDQMIVKNTSKSER